jgi:hypothetical protein
MNTRLMKQLMKQRLPLALLLAGGLCFGQDPRGTILGRVQDQTGAVVPGVAVRVTQVDTGVSATATTNASGNFSIPFLTPGVYRVAAEHAGFKRFVREGIEVRVSDAVELVIGMELGAIADTVEVSAETPLLETAHASLGQVVDRRRILELPQRAGNPMELTLLSPGVVNTTNLRLRGPSAPDALSDVSAEGGGRNATEFQIDGISNSLNDKGSGTPRVAFSPPATAVREFKIETSPYDASVGHTNGTLVNVSTASGTNELHAQAYYWAKNSAFDAPNFFNNKAGTKKTVSQNHRYGAAAGGPVYLPKLYNGRNRTFWHYSYEGNNWGVPTTNTNSVPTAAQRKGDFSQLLTVGSQYQIYDPLTIAPASGGRFSRQPLAGNVIPQSRLDKVGLNLADIYPLPNVAGTADGRNNNFVALAAKQSYYAHMVRVDHAFSETHRLFVRTHYGFFANSNQLDTFNSPASAAIINQIKRGIALDDVIVLSPSLVLNIRYGLSNADFLEKRGSRGTDLAALGFSQNLTSLVDSKLATLPRVQAGAYREYARWQNGDGGSTAVTNTFLGAFTWLRGSHNFKFGADLRVYRTFSNRFSESTSPYLVFPNTYTRGPLDNSPAAQVGQELASMLLGIPGGSMGYTASYAMQDKFLGLYFHDDIKVSPRLTVNLGLRWELESPVTERFDRLVAGFAADVSNPIEAKARANYAANPIAEIRPEDFRVRGGLTWVNEGGVGRSPFRGEKNNFMPRIGLSFQVNPQTTLRTGYGIFYNSIGASNTLGLQTGFSQSTPIQASLDNGLTYVANNANPLPSGLRAPLGRSGGLTTNLNQGFDIYNYNRLHPYSQRWSLNLQRLLPSQFLAEVTYVGNRSTRLGVDRELNSTPAQYLSRSPVRDQTTINYLSATSRSPFSGIDPIYGANISRAALLRPYPEFGDITLLDDSVGYSWYHSLGARVERRLSRGFTFQLGYTFSKMMEAVEFLNATDPTPYETISSLDRPHRLSVSGIWEIPVGRRRRFGSNLSGPACFFLSGWQLNAVVIRQAGPALGFGNAIFTGNLADIALPKGERDVDRWFNTDAGFNRNSQQQLASNIRTFPLYLSGVRGDGQSSWDFSLLKNFSITERFIAQFRAEVYNAWNHTNFNSPNTSPANSAFGRITGTAGDSRNWQFALKLTY